MAQLVRGPFTVKWGANTLEDITEVSLDYEQETNDYTTIDNRRYTIDGAINASVSVTLLKSDVAALAMVIPQYVVANGGLMSSGETVTSADGAIDVLAASCENDPVYNDLDIIGCGANAEVFRLKNARTRIDSMELADNSVRTVTVVFVGEPASGEANVQFFKQNGLSVVS